MRTDILQKLNLPIPKTWDDVHTMLKAMKDGVPGPVPVLRPVEHSRTRAATLLSILGPAYGTYGRLELPARTWDDERQEVRLHRRHRPVQADAAVPQQLVTEKLLDPESFTQTDDQARQKFATGKSFVISSNAQTLVNDYRPDLAKTSPSATLAKIPLPIGPAGASTRRSRLENGIMISAKARDSKNFVAMMQFIDWLWYSDAGQDVRQVGRRGHHLHRQVAAGKLQARPRRRRRSASTRRRTKHLQKDFGFYNGVFAYGGSTDLLNPSSPPRRWSSRR